jgi:polyhydroxyalkanoate synthesis regulator phasin
VNQPKSVFDFLKARGEEFFTQVSDELMSNPQFLKAMQAAWKGKERIDDAVSQALRSMNVPTRAEYKKVLARIDALERELADQRQGVEVLRAEVKKAANDRAAARAAETRARVNTATATARVVKPSRPSPPVKPRPAKRAPKKTGGTPAED